MHDPELGVSIVDLGPVYGVAVDGNTAVRVHLVWDPPWSPEQISAAGRVALGWT